MHRLFAPSLISLGTLVSLTAISASSLTHSATAFSLGDGFSAISSIASGNSQGSNSIDCSESSVPEQFGVGTFVLESRCNLRFTAGSSSILPMTTGTAGASGPRLFSGQYRWDGEPGKRYKIDISSFGTWSYNISAAGNASAVASVRSRNLYRRAYRGKRVAAVYGGGSSSDFRRFNSFEYSQILPSNHHWAEFALGSLIFAKVDTAAAIGSSNAEVALSFTSRAIIREIQPVAFQAFSLAEVESIEDPDIEFPEGQEPLDDAAIDHANAVTQAEGTVLANIPAPPPTVVTPPPTVVTPPPAKSVPEPSLLLGLGLVTLGGMITQRKRVTTSVSKAGA